MWQRVIWTIQICGSVCHRFTRTKPLVLTKMQVIDIAFILRTQVATKYRTQPGPCNNTHGKPSEPQLYHELEPQNLLQWLNHSKMV